MADITPFLTVDEFQGMFGRTLDAAERALADLCLQAAALWIRDPRQRGPDIEITDLQAKLVSYDVVKTAVALPAQFTGHITYARSADDKAESGTLAAALELLDFTSHHRRMLGLAGSRPHAQFGDDDWNVLGFPPSTPYVPVDNY